MADRSIASRPSLEQVMAIVDFMEKHPALALGQLRGLEGRDESKKLWFQLTRIVNNIQGPTRPMKSWIKFKDPTCAILTFTPALALGQKELRGLKGHDGAKRKLWFQLTRIVNNIQWPTRHMKPWIKFWADKKSTVRSKVQSIGGNPNSLCSNIEKKIWDLFLANDSTPKQRSAAIKEEAYIEENFYNEDSMDQEQNNLESDPVLAFDEPPVDAEERQMVIMDKLVTVMSEQAAAMTQMSRASVANAQAMERMADAAQIQARALERLASALSGVDAAALDVRAAVADIDATLKRAYAAPS